MAKMLFLLIGTFIIYFIEFMNRKGDVQDLLNFIFIIFIIVLFLLYLILKLASVYTPYFDRLLDYNYNLSLFISSILSVVTYIILYKVLNSIYLKYKDNNAIVKEQVEQNEKDVH